MKILPSIELTPFIKHYLFLENESRNIRKLRLFSDGNTGIVFSFKSNFISNIQNEKKYDFLPNSFLYGQISEFKDVYLIDCTSLIIIVFQPTGINQLMRVPASELRDNLTEIENILGKQAKHLYENLYEANCIKKQLILLNTLFSKLIVETITANQRLTQESVKFILKTKGLISINQLVKYIGYTERHLERLFNECIGLSPKKFCNIAKLHCFLNLIKRKPSKNQLTAISLEAGYSDQSHLIKEFKKITGITPKGYLNKSNKLTINFIELDSSFFPSEQMSGLYNFSK